MEVRAGLGALTIAVIAGEIVAATWRPPGALVLSLCLAAPLAGLAGGSRRRGVLWTALIVTGLAVGAARMRSVTEAVLPPDHVARLPLPLRTTVEGRIVASPERRDRRVVLLVETEAVGRGAGRHAASGLVRVTIRDPRRRWRYGDRLQAPATLRRPRNFENPGRFDYVGHLARRGVLVTASVWDGRDVTRLPGRARGIRARLERRRARLARAIGAAVPAPASAVLRALVVGDESGIDARLREAFTRAGVVHILSISGLHIGLVAAAAFGFLRWLFARSERLLLAADVERVAAAASVGPVVVYAALAGLGIATLRSALMVAAAVAASLLRRRADVLRTLAFAALVLVLAWPGTPFEIAFQLSFASVIAIVCGTRRLTGSHAGDGWRGRLRQAALASGSALAGTAPLVAWHFHQVSLIGVVANPLTIPIFGSAAVVPGLLGAIVEPITPAGAALLFRVAGVVLRPGIWMVERLAEPAWAAVDIPIPSLVELALLYGTLAALILLPRPGARVLLTVALLGLGADTAWWAHERFGSAALRLTFLDVGQGDATVVELPGGPVLVVDAGGFPGGDFDTGAAVVSPFLLGRKILRIDALVMTHAHPDHSGGLPYLLAHHRPREFWWTGVPGDGAEWERLRAALAASGTRIRVLARGATLPPFAGTAVVLHPPPDTGRMSLNDSSLTLRLGRSAALLTGDIEARAERQLLVDPTTVRAAVLKVPHHGSRTSSTPAFVAAVAPEIAIISVGADNRYKLPSPEIESRYQAAGTRLLRTDHCGAISITITNTATAVKTQRPACTLAGG